VRLLRALPDRYQRLARELLAFGFAGVVNTAFGFLLFNLLFSSMGSLWANAVSTAGGTATSFVLNRYITYRHRPRRSLRQELPLFVVVNLIGLGLQQGIMALAKVTFNLQSTDRLEYNLVRVVSVAIGTVFLLLCYRYLVFRKDKPGVAEDLAIEIGMPLRPVSPGPAAAHSVAMAGPVAPVNGATVNGSTPVKAAFVNGSTPVNGSAPVKGATVNGVGANGSTPAANDPARHSAEATATSNGVRNRTVSPGTFHELTTPLEIGRSLEIGRPAEVALSPELELDELLPIESAPDASGHFRP
jgi:putative flippase GtrA